MGLQGLGGGSSFPPKAGVPVLDAPAGAELQLWQQPQLWQALRGVLALNSSAQAQKTRAQKTPDGPRGYPAFPGNPVPRGAAGSTAEEHFGDVVDALKASEKPQELEMLVRICDSPARGCCGDTGTVLQATQRSRESLQEGLQPLPAVSQLDLCPKTPGRTSSAQGKGFPLHTPSWGRHGWNSPTLNP